MQNWKNSKIVLFSNLFSTFQMINAKMEKFQDSIVLQSVYLLEPLPNIGELETNSDVCERKIRSNSYLFIEKASKGRRIYIREGNGKCGRFVDNVLQ